MSAATGAASRPATPRRGRLAAAARVVAWAARAGWAERVALFTPTTWVFGWVLRLLTQVVFFALIGVLLGSVERVHFLLVGNVAAVVGLGTLAVGVDATDERYHGTLPLLVAAPTSPVLVLSGKTVLWTAESVITGTIALVTLSPLFGLSLSLTEVARAVPVLLAIAAGVYGLGMFMASLLFRAVQIGNTIFNLTFWSMAAICGVNVPVGFFPEPVQAVAYALPLTHGLLALRGVLGVSDVDVGLEVLRELGVGAAWLLLALAGFRWLAEGGRRDGTLDHVP